MVAKLVAEEGIQKGVILSLENGEEWVVGRDPDQCTFSLEDPSASRKHLVLRTTAEGILIENLSETNPTQVNGKNLENPLLLNQGDTVKVGNSLFRFYSTPEAKITEKEEVHDTIFDAEEGHAPERNELAKIDFDFMGGGRWLLKVISGPNNGAEYNMHDKTEYVIGTDPASCDIVFHDNSVSRQHARIAIDDQGNVTIQDLKSRNGTIVDGKKIETPQKLQTNTVVSTGTTSFLVFDREGEMKTIVSPILPSIMKALKEEEPPPPKKVEEEPLKGPTPEVIEAAKAALEAQVIKPAKEKTKSAFGAFMLIGIITGLFVIAGIGTMMLFKSEPVKAKEEVDTDKILKEALQPFAGVKSTFNKATGRLLLVGHVLTPADKSQLLYNLQGLTFIKNIDDSGVIIDEYVWRNLNQILSKNSLWKSITLTSPRPGHFVLTGYLKNRKDAEELYDYINTHFEYLDLLEKKVVVEEDVANAIAVQLRNHGFPAVTVSMENGVVTLAGGIPPDKTELFNTAVSEIKKIPEVRSLKSFVQLQEPEKSVINISDKYKVSGVSQVGKNLSVVINGRILTKGDILDGMTLTDITRNSIMLEKDNVKYRIDY